MRGWLPAEPDRGAPLRLFCFPHAGAGAGAYRPWAAPLAAYGVAVCPVQPPGRETRFGEPAHDRLEALVDALVPSLAPHLDAPFALFGHSLGALVAFAVTRALRAQGGPLPVALHVSGRIAPDLIDPRPRLHDLPDAELLEVLRSLGGIPRAVLDDRGLMALALPVLRADLAVNETYRHSSEPPLNIPITAWGGDRDPKVDGPELAGWSRQTRARFALRLLPGDHFFVTTALPALICGLVAELPIAGEPAGAPRLAA